MWGITRLHKGGEYTLAALQSIRDTRPDGRKICVVLDNLSCNKTPAILAWVAANKVELCFTPTNASWADPIEPHFGPLRAFVIGNSHEPDHLVLDQHLQDYLRWRNAHPRDPKVLAASVGQAVRVTAEDNKRFQESYKRCSRWARRHDKDSA